MHLPPLGKLPKHLWFFSCLWVFAWCQKEFANENIFVFGDGFCNFERAFIEQIFPKRYFFPQRTSPWFMSMQLLFLISAEEIQHWVSDGVLDSHAIKMGFRVWTHGWLLHVAANLLHGMPAFHIRMPGFCLTPLLPIQLPADESPGWQRKMTQVLGSLPLT